MFCAYASQSEKFADLLYIELETKSFDEIMDTSKTFRNFEGSIGCSSLLVNAFNNLGDSHNLICAIENYIERILTDQELQRLVIKCNEYSMFYLLQLPNVILDIKYNETKPESKEDCWLLLNEYFDREPSTDEVNILWCHAKDVDSSGWHFKEVVSQ
jgi:hypothetical protein